jgi:aryl-alcohol dehydrogenase-like predicted oxidoreductase
MQQRPFGRFGTISALTLGGGGLGQVWGETSRDEAIATAREAVDAGITWLDVAPRYGRDREAERVIGEAFEGRLPDRVRVSTKRAIGKPDPSEVWPMLERSVDRSLECLRLERIDLLILHGMIVPDDKAGTYDGTPRSLCVEHVIPAFERLVASGKVGAWGITGIGVPDALIETLDASAKPAAIQCVTNLLDSLGGMKRFEEPGRPRDVIAAANRNGVPVMGIRAVQAGALTDALDRDLPADHPEVLDFRRAARFRAMARELGESAASLAHRYALSMQGVATVVLGVKNRTELRECLAAEAAGPLDAETIARIDVAVNPT